MEGYDHYIVTERCQECASDNYLKYKAEHPEQFRRDGHMHVKSYPKYNANLENNVPKRLCIVIPDDDVVLCPKHLRQLADYIESKG